MEEEKLTDKSTGVWYENIVHKYEKRPMESMANVTLADFATDYSLKRNGEYKREMCLASYAVDSTIWEKS
jgi:hypothetical protein